MQRLESRDDDFTAFVLARSGRLVQIAWMLCGDPVLAEDLVQAALEKAYQRWDRIEMGDPFGYVRQAVVNQHLSWIRRRTWREQPSGGTTELDLNLAGHVVDLSRAADQRVVIAQGLATLTRRERAVILLRFVEDLTEAQTAAALGVAVGTIKSTAARALKKLRASAALADSYIGEAV